MALHFPMKNRFLLIIFSYLVIFSLHPQEIRLPDVLTVVSSSKRESTVIEVDKERLEKFSSIEGVLESEGISFKKSNDETTFHGYWNSSIKVFVDDVLMNDPNTGKFQWDSIDYAMIKKIRIDTASANGCVSVYISTIENDYTKIKAAVNGETKSYLTSPFDSSMASVFFSVPLEFKSGTALFFSNAMSVRNTANHFGYRSTSVSYTPGFCDSYSGYKKNYEGYESFVFNDSFLMECSPSWFEGSKIGFRNFISWNDSNCGSNDGYYFSKEKQRNLNLGFSLPVFLPFNNVSVKIIPTYKFSDLLYTKEARYSDARDEYKINGFSLQQDVSFLKFFNVSSTVSYEESFQSSYGLDGVEKNNMMTAFVSPSLKFKFSSWLFDFSLPVNYFKPSNSLQLLYKAYGEFEAGNYTFSLCASKNSTNPVFQQLYYSGSGGSGNPGLVPETAFSFALGVKYSGIMEVSLNPFLIFYRDKIGWSKTGMNMWTPENMGSSRNFGFDLNFSTKDFFGFMEFDLKYTICKALLSSGGESDGNQIMYTPVHTLSATTDMFFNNFKWTTCFFYNSKKFIDNTNEGYVPDYFNVDSKIAWNYKNATVYFVWNNVFDFQYTQIESYPSPGTSVTFGAKFNGSIRK